MKDSIKREQSQAGLSFAERKNFRPKVKRNKLLLLLALLMTAATGAWAQEPTTYSAKMKDGTVDAKNWSIASGEKSAKGDAADGLTGLSEGDAVTLQYNGRLKVKGVKAVKKVVTDLSMVDNAGNERTDGQWTANCYMVHSAGDYKLPLVYGNAIKSGATNSAAYTGVSGQLETFPRHDGQAITAPWIKDNGITVASAELLWQDAQGLITAVDISGDYLTLTVGKSASEQEGNALVAAKDGNGAIVWSWHIWVTKQTFASTDLTTIATGSHDYQVTPVNLGWVGDVVSQGYCTYYQWGRKDAFIPGTGTSNNDNHAVYDISGGTVTDAITHSTADVGIDDNIKNPTTFYNVDNKPNNTTFYNLWDAQQTGTGNITTATKKTVYDPCPAGFCVPTGNFYHYMCDGGTRNDTNWDGTNNGKLWTSGGVNLYFPASGYRPYSSGTLGNVGSNGCNWSASASNSDGGYFLDFYSGYWVWASARRANGFPVRAVADDEEAAAASLIVNAVVGQIIGSDGKNYDANATLPTGVTAVAKIFYVGSDAETSTTYNHGLALALSDVSGNQTWCSQTSSTCLTTQYSSSSAAKADMAGLANTDALVGHGSHTHYAASAARNYNGGTHPTGTSEWFLPSAGQWDKMATAAGGYGTLKTNAGLQWNYYWSCSERNAYDAWYFYPDGDWSYEEKNFGYLVRACLAF